MSFLIIELTSKGLIFSADRNVTTTYSDGSENQNIKTQKILQWPIKKALVGFVGQGQIGGLLTKDWIQNFINANLHFSSLKDIATKLQNDVERQIRIDEPTEDVTPLIIHLGGFESFQDTARPEIYLITNAYGLDNNGYKDFRKEFKTSEELWRYFPGITNANDLKIAISKMENHFEPFWFHQGLDLVTFNVLHAALKLAFKSLIQNHPKHKLPTTLQEWEKHAKMQILMYGTYFESFHLPTELYVGGGADVLSIEWK